MIDRNKIFGYCKDTGRPITWGEIQDKVDAKLKPLMEVRQRQFEARLSEFILEPSPTGVKTDE